MEGTEEKTKTDKNIAVVFKDYQTADKALKNMKINKVNMYQKKNVLELYLYTETIVSIVELAKFKEYLKNKFQLENVLYKIEYSDLEEDRKRDLEKEWKDITLVIAKDYPIIKTFLSESNLKIEENIAKIKTKICGLNIAQRHGATDYLVKFFKDLYDLSLKIEFTTCDVEDLISGFDKKRENIIKQYAEESKEAQKRNEENKTEESLNEQDGEVDWSKFRKKKDPEQILGWETETSAPKVKLMKANAKTGPAYIEGEISGIGEIRKIKTRDDLYIGMLTLTDYTMQIKVKIFLKEKTMQDVLKRLIPGTLIKVIGEIGYDKFEKEVNMMGKHIIELEASEKTRLERERDELIGNTEDANALFDSNELSGMIPSIKETKQNKMIDERIIYGYETETDAPVKKIADLSTDKILCQVVGEVVSVGEFKELKNKEGLFLGSISVYDTTSTINIKMFIKDSVKDDALKRMKPGSYIRVIGEAGYDKYDKEIAMMANHIIEEEKPKGLERKDNAEVKRVELHLHTQMSQMDAVTPAKDLIKRAMKWNMKAMAITDHGVVQSFPDAHKLMQDVDTDFKVIYGVEAYLVPDKTAVVSKEKGQTLDDTTYCVFDLETTGISFRTEKITEIGVMKYRNGEVIDTFETFVNPEKHIPEKVQEITKITDDMVKDAPKIEEVLPKLLEFFGDSVLVAHNADFDTSFIRYNCDKLGYDFDYTYLDTLRLAKELFPDFKKYKLGIIADNLGIKVEVAHRALDDVDTTVKVLRVMMDMLKEKGVKYLRDIDSDMVNKNKDDYKKIRPNHAIILAKDYIGLRNLYKLVSLSHVDYFYKKPRILKSLYRKNSEGLILGSACDQGELYQAILAGKTDEELEEIAKDYDYLEIQPIGNDEYLVREGVLKSNEDLRDIVRKIVALGEKLNKPVCATCDVHFLDPQDEIYRRIIQGGQGYQDADNQAPLYLRTTEEMLKEFDFLGEDKSYEVVVTNTNKIADMCEKITPISPEKCPPYIPGCEQTLEDITYKKAHDLYGETLPKIVEDRIKKELDSIIKNGFSVMYIIAQKLVWKSNDDGYIVGSRGSVGSSFAAFLAGITEVNSLPAHYRCGKCKYSEFEDFGVKNGADLPDKICPKCGEELIKDGMDIPFETFLGFNGDKEPDIDLNFSGEYQAKAHKYTEVIFGKGTTFKAGTVGTVAEKTAYGYVMKYFEERGIPVASAEVARISTGCVGIKRTTGQHPGGIIVVPKGREIYEFTPVQHPADDPKSDIITTHFDYHSIDQNLLKLDILGHDDPTIIRMLYDLTGYDPTKVPLDDKATMSIYSSTEALGVTQEDLGSNVGTFGIPESGTKFVREMLNDTKPTTFEELIRISGLSHGTDVWLGNAKDLVDSKTAKLSQVICTRDDIMLYLIDKGLEPNTAFKIMELVRKGKVAKNPDKWANYKKEMEEHNVPDWYIESCNKIKYLFPKAHAAAYVTNAFRIAWFKVHIPKAYYTAYYTIRADAFDEAIMCHGQERVKNKMKEIKLMESDATQKDKAMYETLEIVNEMYLRGIEFLDIDLYKSHPTKFKMESGGIRPPLNTIAGFGTVAAQQIEEARKGGEFMSISDLQQRARIGKTGIELLRETGCLKGMPESNQMSLFDMF